MQARSKEAKRWLERGGRARKGEGRVVRLVYQDVTPW